MKQTENTITNTTSQKYNKKAIVGFALSLTSIFGIGLAGMIGTVLGIMALKKIDDTHEKGRGFAIAATIIGSIWGFGKSLLAIYLASNP